MAVKPASICGAVIVGADEPDPFHHADADLFGKRGMLLSLAVGPRIRAMRPAER